MEQLDNTAQAEPLSTIEIQSSRLIRLPIEMLLAITNFFELHDKFLFSHTCGRAREVIGMDLKSWEKLFPLQYPSRFQGKPAKVFLAGLAWAMPNHWTALKLTRMKNNGVFVDCRLLNKVLQSHEITSRCEWNDTLRGASSPLGFSCNLMAAFEKRGTPVKGYCKYCLLDHILVATADSFIVESWQSLGRYDRPQDALTDKPLFGDLPPEDGCWPLLSGADLSPRSGVALMGGELVCHQPGSVRDAYMSE
ncbi:hypothetical protein CKAH01_10244 [Colletotrichum kahawae]|uniref:F-box domain-containing protein n=1 Tax=Colletotrichum kahawae TaxID=34407 RepID=A0AAD9XXV5_COLKA|nr:hypothetical protein CKAH01_10244 [Colletotrichum kahawae]